MSAQKINMLRPGFDQRAKWLQELLEAAEAKATWRNAVQGMVADLEGAVNRLEDAQRKAWQVMQDPTLAPEYKQQRAAEVVAEAREAGLATVGEVMERAADLRKVLWGAVVPPPPKGMSEAALLDAKADLVRYLDSVPSEGLVKAMLEALGEALRDGDAAAAYWLGQVGWLRFYLRARGVDPATYENNILNVLPESPAKRLLTGGLLDGPNGLYACVTLAKAMLEG
ncbi:MAG: hypothetical protein H5T59_04075 [Anaerolineae bacterium]|nr:hypothetical protein [Anaerolineae bacterium]